MRWGMHMPSLSSKNAHTSSTTYWLIENLSHPLADPQVSRRLANLWPLIVKVVSIETMGLLRSKRVKHRQQVGMDLAYAERCRHRASKQVVQFRQQAMYKTSLKYWNRRRWPACPSVRCESTAQPPTARVFVMRSNTDSYKYWFVTSIPVIAHTRRSQTKFDMIQLGDCTLPDPMLN